MRSDECEKRARRRNSTKNRMMAKRFRIEEHQHGASMQAFGVQLLSQAVMSRSAA